MNCSETEQFLHAYMDGELDLINSLAVEQHLHECQRCMQQWENQQALRNKLSDATLYFKAPTAVRERLVAAVRPAVRKSAPGRPPSWSWLTFGLPLAAALVAAAVLLPSILSGPRARNTVMAELTTSHVRSLMPGHLADVASSDRHTVKPWFAGKLDFSPPVKDLAGAGFPLTGGRLDYIGQRPVAALVYQRHQHLINLFVWPSTDRAVAPAVAGTRQGYNMVRWAGQGMAFWAVSDLNDKELLEFAQLFTRD
jgi:anti-sigma factor RsiW